MSREPDERSPVLSGTEKATMRIHTTRLKTGITTTKEFAKKGLATHGVNPGVKCGHDCLYCSSGAMLRWHRAFQELGLDPFGHGYAIVDPTTPERVARDAARMRGRGTVQLCTTTDAWAPEAQQQELGRRCLKAILLQLGWTVRILSKNAAIRDDFDLMETYRDRVLVGLSITAPPDKGDIIEIIEPNASSITDRMLALEEAAARGLRTSAMFCPLLPGIADSAAQIDQLVNLAVECPAEEIFVELVNPRGPGLRHCQDALELWGCEAEARAIGEVRRRSGWSAYVARLLANVQESVRRHSEIDKLRFLLYPSRLMSEDETTIRKDDAGVVWLGKKSGSSAVRRASCDSPPFVGAENLLPGRVV